MNQRLAFFAACRGCFAAFFFAPTANENVIKPRPDAVVRRVMRVGFLGLTGFCASTIRMA